MGIANHLIYPLIARKAHRLVLSDTPTTPLEVVDLQGSSFESAAACSMQDVCCSPAPAALSDNNDLPSLGGRTPESPLRHQPRLF
jgi:hypothetical protein